MQFLFVDYDTHFVYKYSGFKTGPGNNRLSKKLVASDIMEFMFLITELYGCGRKLDCKYCNNTQHIKDRLVELINKYSKSKSSYPMISETDTTLLDLKGAKVPFLTPLQILCHYLGIKSSKGNNIRSILYKSIHKMLK